MDKMDKLEIDETPSSAIQPVPPPELIDIEQVEKLYADFYNRNDELNRNAYNQGKLLPKDKTAGHVLILKNIIFLILDDLKDLPGDEKQALIYDKTTTAIMHLTDLLEVGVSDVKTNKHLVAKLFGYIFSLHNIHNV